MFKNFDLVGVDGAAFELPVQFRVERHNFNPNQCIGNFDYDSAEKPIILKDKQGVRIDKNLRRVNQQGWLVDADGNVIDNMGKVRFIKEQLSEKGELPKLYNFEGAEYKIKQIIGQFERDKNSKEIILCRTEQKGVHVCCDVLGRKVNNKGYLIDERGNIVDKKGVVIWRSFQLLFNEPPKIFQFTEFSLNWIRGTLDKDVTQNPRHDDEFDLEGRRINVMGYLIDEQENIVDAFRGKVLFKREVLEAKFGQEAEIPYIFRSGKLLQPPLTDKIERRLELKHQISLKKGKVLAQGPGQGDNGGEEESDSDDDIIRELKRMENQRDNVFGQLDNGDLRVIRDEFGRLIEEIPLS
mmetsp:Transcript_12674/g.21324  ORF Transcript_12674/g.21324 Transcript_12674/m.21324 type:complete len:353 (-) Transcript_12674:460-1518(-)